MGPSSVFPIQGQADNNKEAGSLAEITAHHEEQDSRAERSVFLLRIQNRRQAGNGLNR